MNTLKSVRDAISELTRLAKILLVLIALGIGVLVWQVAPDSQPADVLEPTVTTSPPVLVTVPPVTEPVADCPAAADECNAECPDDDEGCIAAKEIACAVASHPPCNQIVPPTTTVGDNCPACIAACLVSPDACAACESEHHCAIPPTTTETEVGYSGANPGPFPPPSQTVKFIENTFIPNLDDLGALTDPNPDNPDFKAVLAWLSHAKKMLADARGDDWTAVRTGAIAMTEVWIPARPSQSQWQEYRQKVFCNLGGVLANIGDKGQKADT